jgi:hypothetical protein
MGAHRKVPPESLKPLLTGLCNCGCGERTKIATCTVSKRDQYIDWPRRFIHGHNPRGEFAERARNWQGGRHFQKPKKPVLHQGYVLVKRHGHPNADMNGYVKEHRLVMSEFLGRPLERFEHVHHKDGNRGNNALDNLELWSCIHPPGSRPEELVAFAKRVLTLYPHLA